MKHENQSRRSFVSTMAGAALGFAIVPRHVLGGQGFTAPSDTVNFAIVGLGGQGLGITRGAIDYGQKLVAIVDVDMEAANLRGGGPPNPAAIRALAGELYGVRLGLLRRRDVSSRADR